MAHFFTFFEISTIFTFSHRSERNISTNFIDFFAKFQQNLQNIGKFARFRFVFHIFAGNGFRIASHRASPRAWMSMRIASSSQARPPARRSSSRSEPTSPTFVPGLKGSIGDRSNHSNFSRQNSDKILSEFRKIHQELNLEFSENF